MDDGLVCFSYLPSQEQHHARKIARLRNGLQKFATDRRVLVTLNAPLTNASDVALALATVESVFKEENIGVQETQYRDDNVSFSVSVDSTRTPGLILDAGPLREVWLAGIVQEVENAVSRAALYDEKLSVAVVTVGPVPVHTTRWVRTLYGVPTRQHTGSATTSRNGFMGRGECAKLVAIWCAHIAYSDTRFYGFANPWSEQNAAMRKEIDFYCALGQEKGQIIFNSGYDAANFLETQ